MSKIGKMPIVVKDNVQVAVDGQQVKVSGSKGNVDFTVPRGIQVTLEDGKLVVAQQKANDNETKALFGLTRASLANILHGVAEGFEKRLELSGVGYRAQMQGADLVLSLGYAHPVRFKPRSGVTLNVVDNAIVVSGTDKALVGEMAAEIRAVKPPEPYKGKGIKYAGERIKRKAGKAAKAVGGK